MLAADHHRAWRFSAVEASGSRPGIEQVDPGQPRFRHRNSWWSAARWRLIEAAGGHLDRIAVQVVEGQRRAAGGAEMPLGGGRALKAGRLAAGPGEIGGLAPCRGGERAADRFLAHAAVANGRLRAFEQRVTHRRRTGIRRSSSVLLCHGSSSWPGILTGNFMPVATGRKCRGLR